MTYFTTLSIDGSLSNQIFKNINGIEELQKAVIKFNHKAVILFFYPESDRKFKQQNIVQKHEDSFSIITSAKDIITLVSKLEKTYPNLKTFSQRPSINSSIIGQCSETTIRINDTTISISDFGISYDKELGKKVSTLFAGIVKNNQLVWNGNIFGKHINELIKIIVDNV